MDATTETVSVPTKTRKPINWWKVGFFVMLLAFEVVREWAVLGNVEERPVHNVDFSLISVDGLTTAQGIWKRIDGGGKMMPASIRIECWQDRALCLEISANTYGKYVPAPEVDYFDAKFSPDAVTYENDNPTCAKYSVRMDLKLNKVFAVRQRKENPSNPTCAQFEPRIEMVLSSYAFEYENPTKGHFVPLLSLVMYLLGGSADGKE